MYPMHFKINYNFQSSNNMDSIIKEAEKARAKYGHFNSTHELYGVLKEEVDEFWEVVKLKRSESFHRSVIQPDIDKMILELTQIAAIAYRGIKELENDEIKFV